MFLAERDLNGSEWNFIAWGNNAPRTLLNPSKEYRYFFITA